MVKYFKLYTTNEVTLHIETHINNLIYKYIDKTDTYIIVKIIDGNINNVWSDYEMEDITNNYIEE